MLCYLLIHSYVSLIVNRLHLPVICHHNYAMWLGTCRYIARVVRQCGGDLLSRHAPGSNTQFSYRMVRILPVHSRPPRARVVLTSAYHWQSISGKDPTLPHILGIEVDTAASQLWPPQDKLARLKSLLEEWRDRKACTRSELESLIGVLKDQTPPQVIQDRPERTRRRRGIRLRQS